MRVCVLVCACVCLRVLFFIHHHIGTRLCYWSTSTATVAHGYRYDKHSCLVLSFISTGVAVLLLRSHRHCSVLCCLLRGPWERVSQLCRVSCAERHGFVPVVIVDSLRGNGRCAENLDVWSWFAVSIL